MRAPTTPPTKIRMPEHKGDGEGRHAPPDATAERAALATRLLARVVGGRDLVEGDCDARRQETLPARGAQRMAKFTFGLVAPARSVMRSHTRSRVATSSAPNGRPKRRRA